MQRHSCKSSLLLPPAHHLQHSSLGWISAGKRQHHEHGHVQHQGLHCHVSKKPGNYCFELQVTSGDPHLRGAKDITSMSAPSEHTGNCISFTLDKGSYNPVKGLWKGLQWCKVCCENQVRISPLPTRHPNFLQLHPLLQSICALLPLLWLQLQSNKR